MNNRIVFIHGSGDSARIWRLQVEYFGKERAFAVDLPGHGERADSLPEEASVMDYARAVDDIITQELQLDRPIIAGNSLGGAIGLTMGLEYGEELGGLILIGTGARLRVVPDLLESARKTPEQGNRWLKEMGIAPTTDLSMAVALINEQATPGPGMFYRDLSACNRFDVMGRLGEIHLPALIICGAEDRLTPVKFSQYLHEHIANSTLRVIPSAGHFVFREQPEEVNRVIEEWMR